MSRAVMDQTVSRVSTRLYSTILLLLMLSVRFGTELLLFSKLSATARCRTVGAEPLLAEKLFESIVPSKVSRTEICRTGRVSTK